jgi:hypothetical protein
VSIVSDDEHSSRQPPAVRSRRIPAHIAISVVVGCAVLGATIGILRPLRPSIPNPQRVEEPASLRLASAKLAENAEHSSAVLPEHPAPIVAGQPAPELQTLAPPAAASVSTGSVDRSASSGPSESAALTTSDQQGAARSEPTTSRSYRIARAKRLKRVLWHRLRSKRPSVDLDAYFAKLFSKI